MAYATPIRTEDLPPYYPTFTGRVVFVSDTEFQRPNKLMDDIIQTVRSGDTLVFVGDILTLPPGSSTSARKAWDVVIPFFERLKDMGVRPIVILGNHDGPMQTASDVLSPVVGQYYGSGSVEKSFTFINGDMAFICLSGRTQHDLDSSYLRRTLVDLESKGLKKVTIVSHYPIDQIGKMSLSGPRIGSSLLEDKKLYEILSDFSSRLDLTVLGGHQHVAFSGDYISSDSLIKVRDIHLPSPKIAYRYPNGSRSQKGYAVFSRMQFSLLSLSGEPLITPSQIKGTKGTFKSDDMVVKTEKPNLRLN
ncbi:MAG: metallophosphoesterase [Candidatus Micrarchaeota archaeon]